MLKKIITLFLCLILIVSVSGCENNNSKDSAKKFDKLMNQLALKMIDDDDLVVNQLVDNLRHYGLKNEVFEWEKPSLKKYKKLNKSCDDILKKMKDIDYDSLSENQKITYDSVYGILNLQPKDLTEKQYFYLDNNPLGKYNGNLNDIPTSFLVLEFKDKKDVESYINLLNTLDSYFKSLADFEQERQDNDYGMTPDEINLVKQDCKKISTTNNAWLKRDFETKLSKAKFLNDKEKQKYLNELDVNKFNKAFKNLETYLSKINIKTDNGTLLCDYEGGKAYYKYLIETETGFKDIYDYKDYLDSKLDLETLSGTVLDKISSINYIDEEADIVKTKDLNQILKLLNKRMKSQFTSIGKVKFNMEQLPKELEPIYEGVGAFYLPSEVDRKDSDESMMMVGDFEDTDFTTVAHEGFPGHMYQHVFYKNVKHPFIKDLLSSSWYSEGYANYIQELACNYADNKQAALSNELQNELTYFVLIQIDFMVNYEGEYDKAVDYLTTLFGLEEKDAKEMLQQICWSPTTFVPYYVGGEMINDMMQKLGNEEKDSYVKKFNKAYNEIGPAYPKTVYKWLKIKLKEDKDA